MNPITNPSDFKWHHFRGEIILWAVRWCCKYAASYRNLGIFAQRLEYAALCILKGMGKNSH